MKKLCKSFPVLALAIILAFSFSSCQLFQSHETRVTNEMLNHLEEKYGKRFEVAPVNFPFHGGGSLIELYVIPVGGCAENDLAT